MILYRGDNINNELTNPKIYRFDGLRSKAFGKGDPSYVNRNGLIESIRQHINPETENDRRFYEKTDFISFSTCIERSMYWLTSKNTIEIADCSKDHKATRFLFIMNIHDNELKELSNGIYEFKFKCNPKLKKPNTDDALFNSALHLMYGYNDCPICKASEPAHKIMLIDVVKYLSLNINEKKFDRAIESATTDKEWLILPFDMVDANSKIEYSRIPRANFWTVKHYIKK